MAPNDEWREGLLNCNPQEQFGVHMKEVILEKVRLGCTIPVDAQIWADMEVNAVQAMDFMRDQVVFQFSTTVFKEKLPPQSISEVVEFTKPVSISTFEPKSPWQFWKERHQTGRWIGWFVRLFPHPDYREVEHTKVVRHSEKVTVDLRHSVIYPEAKAISSPNMGNVAVRWVEAEWQK